MSVPQVPISDSVTFICSLKEAHFFLYERLRVYDRDDAMTFGVLSNLVEDVLGDEVSRDPVGSNFDNAIREMADAGMPMEEARNAAIQAGDLIITSITDLISNFGSGVYKNAYEYFLRSPYDVYISIQRSVFTNADVSAPRPRPYRL